MEIGKLKHRIRVYEIKNVKNDEGSYVKEKNEVARPFAEVSKHAIKEFKSMDLSARREQVYFIIRYFQKVTITSEMYVDFKGKTFEIKNIEHDYQDYDRSILQCEVVE